MKLTLECDKCGKSGTPDEIGTNTNYDGLDLCRACGRSAKLAELKREYARKKEWLESTYLQELRDLKLKIEQLSRERPKGDAKR